MSEKDNGGAAFPSTIYGCESGGMSLRDYFAGRAASAIWHVNQLAGSMTSDEAALEITNMAVLAYRIADAMLAERAKT